MLTIAHCTQGCNLSTSIHKSCEKVCWCQVAVIQYWLLLLDWLLHHVFSEVHGFPGATLIPINTRGPSQTTSWEILWELQKLFTQRYIKGSTVAMVHSECRQAGSKLSVENLIIMRKPTKILICFLLSWYAGNSKICQPGNNSPLSKVFYWSKIQIIPMFFVVFKENMCSRQISIFFCYLFLN